MKTKLLVAAVLAAGCCVVHGAGVPSFAPYHNAIIKAANEGSYEALRKIVEEAIEFSEKNNKSTQLQNALKIALANSQTRAFATKEFLEPKIKKEPVSFPKPAKFTTPEEMVKMGMWQELPKEETPAG